MNNFKTIILVVLALGLSACAPSHEVYEPGQVTTTPISLPEDLNQADVQDHYRIPDVVHEKQQSKAKTTTKPPTIKY